MHPPSSLQGGLKISEKSLLGARGQKFLFWWRGGSYFVGGGEGHVIFNELNIL